MSESDWVTVGVYTGVGSAEVASGLLTGLGIPSRIYRPPAPRFRSGECYVWVPPQLAEVARTALAPNPVSEEELTRLALKSTPPEDV
jgi:hypothetical protein